MWARDFFIFFVICRRISQKVLHKTKCKFLACVCVKRVCVWCVSLACVYLNPNAGQNFNHTRKGIPNATNRTPTHTHTLLAGANFAHYVDELSAASRASMTICMLYTKFVITLA